jgi:hypothetical protein
VSYLVNRALRANTKPTRPALHDDDVGLLLGAAGAAHA